MWALPFSLKVWKSIPRDRDRQRSTMIEVEGTIVAFSLKKKIDLSLLSIECRILDRCRASTDLQVSMPTSDLWAIYIFPRLVLSRPIWGIYTSNSRTETWMWKLGDRSHRKVQLYFGNNEDAQFHSWEYINRKQTFILDSSNGKLSIVEEQILRFVFVP